MFHQGRSGRGTELAPDLAAVNRQPGQNQGSSRCGHRQNAVGAFYRAAAHMNRGNCDAIGTDHGQEQAVSHHIGHGVQTAHFMEVDMLHRFAMDRGLCAGNQIVHCQGILLHFLWNVQSFNDAADVRQTMMGMVMIVFMIVVMVMIVFMIVVMMVVMVVIVMVMVVVVMMVVMVVMVMTFFFPVYQHMDMGSGNAAFHGLFSKNLHTGNSKAAECLEKCFLFLRRKQFQQRRHEHVAGNSHITFDI